MGGAGARWPHKAVALAVGRARRRDPSHPGREPCAASVRTPCRPTEAGADTPGEWGWPSAEAWGTRPLHGLAGLSDLSLGAVLATCCSVTSHAERRGSNANLLPLPPFLRVRGPEEPSGAAAARGLPRRCSHSDSATPGAAGSWEGRAGAEPPLLPVWTGHTWAEGREGNTHPRKDRRTLS